MVYLYVHVYVSFLPVHPGRLGLLHISWQRGGSAGDGSGK